MRRVSGNPDIDDDPRCMDGSSTTNSAGFRVDDAMARLIACAFVVVATTATG
ncbi:hypothetical protein Rhow_008360 [Rhodococcus wratislaviensis]|uniref:Uncharacterized protein n=1 Tax=Rhodococcus wratislaviensis TaxID=44752 RepID=A0A402CKC9_RHOWR|nr:hypothetical protein Rhow_008360 [Rhodococcus wratislaviensis]